MKTLMDKLVFKNIIEDTTANASGTPVGGILFTQDGKIVVEFGKPMPRHCYVREEDE